MYDGSRKRPRDLNVAGIGGANVALYERAMRPIGRHDRPSGPVVANLYIENVLHVLNP